MKRIVIAAAVLLTTALVIKAEIKETGNRVSLVKGNELYAWCTTAQKTMILSANNEVKTSGSADDMTAASQCWGYVEGVVDSTPAGDGFKPASDVRLSQYVDVVTEYLKAHANIRNKPAAGLIQDALVEAFSGQ